MTLPYDYARCTGGNLPECGDCMRTEPGCKFRQSFFAAPPCGDEGCEYRISYKTTTQHPVDS